MFLLQSSCLIAFGLMLTYDRRSQSLSDTVTLARRGADGDDWLVELIKLGESHGIPVMRRFFWEVLRFIAFWEIVKRFIGHADDAFIALIRGLYGYDAVRRETQPSRQPYQSPGQDNVTINWN